MEDLKWFKSSRSDNGGNTCVEVAFLGHGTAVRDSKDRSGPVLVFGDQEWASFVNAVKNNRFGWRDR